MKAEYLFAVDPGKLTGWMEYHVPTATVTDGGEDDMMTFLDHAYGVVSVKRPIVVCEKFIITGRTAKLSQQTWSLEIIGALKWMVHRHGRDIALQTPADAKKFADNKRLRDTGVWTKGSAGHINDAARHLILFLARNGLQTPTGSL